MLLSISTAPRLEGFFQLVGLILVFILILVGIHFTTKWIGKATYGQVKNHNIKIIETVRISPNHHLQIVSIGEKYIVIGVSKDQISFLTEVEKDQIHLEEMKGADFNLHFKEVLEKIGRKK